MCGKKLVANLVGYYGGLSAIDIPIYNFDINQTKELPCIVVGFENEEMSFPGGYGHYTVAGYTLIHVQGYEDSDNSVADGYAALVIDALSDQVELMGSVNSPQYIAETNTIVFNGEPVVYNGDPLTITSAISAADTRPAREFTLNGLFIRSVNRNIEGNSTEIEIKYDAFCAAKD